MSLWGTFLLQTTTTSIKQWKNVTDVAFNGHLKPWTTTKKAKDYSRLKVTEEAESSKAMDLKKNGIHNWEFSKLSAFDNIIILWKINYLNVNGLLLLWESTETEAQKKTKRGG